MIPTTELQRPIIKTELPGPMSREIIAADADAHIDDSVRRLIAAGFGRTR